MNVYAKKLDASHLHLRLYSFIDNTYKDKIASNDASQCIKA